MTTRTMCYPGDPPLAVRELTREEFLKEFRGEPFRIYADGKLDKEIPIPPDMICCDYCNAQPESSVFVCEDEAYCQECFKTWWLPHCQ